MFSEDSRSRAGGDESACLHLPRSGASATDRAEARRARMACVGQAEAFLWARDGDDGHPPRTLPTPSANATRHPVQVVETPSLEGFVSRDRRTITFAVSAPAGDERLDAQAPLLVPPPERGPRLGVHIGGTAFNGEQGRWRVASKHPHFAAKAGSIA